MTHSLAGSTLKVPTLAEARGGCLPPSAPHDKLAICLDGSALMNTVGVFEAKNRLTALLDQVEAGGEVLITRRGKPVARLVPAATRFDRERARRAAEGLRAASKGLTLGGLTIGDLIAEGRR